MAILQGILNKLLDLIPNKQEDKPEVDEKHSYDEYYLKQYRSSVRSMCDCVKDNGKYCVYPSEYIVWQTGYESANIKDLAIFITSTRNIYRPNEYDLVLQTDIPLEHLGSLYTCIIYRIIVLKKYNKEDKPMDEKQKILNDIEEAQRKLDEARKKLDEYNTGYKRFKPKNNEVYYYVISNGMVGRDYQNDNFTTDIKRYDFYNCFKTREQAEAEAEKILVRRMLEDIARRLNKGEKIDWNNNDQFKYFLRFSFFINKISINYNFQYKDQGTVYCLDKNFLDVAVKEIGEERLKKYLRGED